MVQQTVYSRDVKTCKTKQMAAPSDVRSALPKGSRRLRYGLAAIVLTSLATLLVFALGFLKFWALIEPGAGQEIGRADAIVALTGGEARIPEAVKLLAQGKGRRLLISGVNPTTTRKELAGLTPNSQHWFRCCIDVGREARDTIGNADETSQWVKERRFKSLIVVTASYHMPRSLAELRRTLPDVELLAYPVQPRNVHIGKWWTHPGTLQLLLIEYVKFVPSFARCVGAQLGSGVSNAARQCLNSVPPV